MKSLIVVNNNLSTRTALFWNKHKQTIEGYLQDTETIFPESSQRKPSINFEAFDTVVLIGDDRFFNRFINAVYYELTSSRRNTCIAFIPDSRHSALAAGLKLPGNLSCQLDLIVKRQSIYLDLIRCYYIAKNGEPSNRFVLNDAIIGIASGKAPLLLKTIVELVKNPPLLPIGKNKHITLSHDGDILYSGSYTFSAVMLGCKFTDGPALPGRLKIRCNLSDFSYYQLNSNVPTGIFKKVIGRLGKSVSPWDGVLFSGNYNELAIKGDGEGNTIIADGIYLGKLPATFTFIPKALKVIAPLLTIRVSQPWMQKIPARSIPKPAGSRRCLRTKHAAGSKNGSVIGGPSEKL